MMDAKPHVAHVAKSGCGLHMMRCGCASLTRKVLLGILNEWEEATKPEEGYLKVLEGSFSGKSGGGGKREEEVDDG